VSLGKSLKGMSGFKSRRERRNLSTSNGLRCSATESSSFVDEIKTSGSERELEMIAVDSS